MTTTAKRLSAVETSLGPKALVLNWLAEAQQYDEMGEYVQAQIARLTIQMPLDRLIEAAIENAAARTRGQSAQAAQDARTRDVRSVVYRFFLVSEAWQLTEAAIDRDELMYCAAVASMGGHLLGVKTVVPPLERLESLRDRTLRQVTRLLALQVARERIARQHFDGRGLLLPGVDRRWSSRVHDTQLLRVMVLRLAELDGVAPIDDSETEPTEELVAQQIAAHVDAARVKTYDALGDGPRLREALRKWVLPGPSVARTVSTL
jgi:hypothetical protein